jgi:hypothetical protein
MNSEFFVNEYFTIIHYDTPYFHGYSLCITPKIGDPISISQPYYRLWDLFYDMQYYYIQFFEEPGTFKIEYIDNARIVVKHFHNKQESNSEEIDNSPVLIDRFCD